MQHEHGISVKTRRPFSPPMQTRESEGSAAFEGECHNCGKWVPIGEPGQARSGVNLWWKHAAACHKVISIKGEGGWYIEDEVSRRLRNTATTCIAFQSTFALVLILIPF